MSLEIAGQHSLERQISLARGALPLLAILALQQTEGVAAARYAVWLVGVYWVLGIVIAALPAPPDSPRRIFASWADVLFSALFLALSPSIIAFWFIFLAAAFAMGARGQRRAGPVTWITGAAAVVIRAGIRDPVTPKHLLDWLALGASTFLIAAVAGFIGTRERQHWVRQGLLQRTLDRIQFDKGLSESIRQTLGEICLAFECELACLVILDDELDRLFVWKVRPSDQESLVPETHSRSEMDTFLLDSMEVTACWNGLNGTHEGFGWDRRTKAAYKHLPELPPSTAAALDARALMAASIETSGRPSGRLMVVNPPRRFARADLEWFEQVVEQIDTPLENIFLLRHVRARAIEAERSRISRDLHDSILQTLLSLKIQLDVLKRKLPEHPDQIEPELDRLKQTVQQESEELRRFVTDLRPVRVESADLRELMFGFAERYQREADLAVDLFIEDGDLRVSDRVCREIFQIYREALNNIKKHAHASHVVVKLGQDEAKVSLVVDDNGLGFSFSGRYSSEELDRLRLGPISIKERARGVGGTLTLESNPGHGARLTVEIPLN
jgi:signal transduction histidine kinase